MKDAAPTRSTPDRPPERSFRPVSALFLMAILTIIYNSNMRCVRSYDSEPQRYLPFSIIWEHSVYLDRWVRHLLLYWHSGNVYFVKYVHGHWLSVYPIILPIVLVPIYFLPAKLLAMYWSRPVVAGVLFPLVADTMGKLCASLIAALSAAILYLALRKKASPGASLMIALVYAVASNTFSTSSQALWRHGFTELCFASLIWILWSEWSDSKKAFWAGLALGAAAANNLVECAILLPFLFYFGRRPRKELVLCLIPATLLGILVLSYNLHFFGEILGGYPNPFIARHANALVVPAPFYVRAAGLLISPSRGLLIYSSWTLFSLWGAGIMWKQNSYGWARHLICGMVIFYALHARLGDWWGGQCFGPRYMTDLLPFFAIFLLPVSERIWSSGILRIVAALAIAASLWVQVVGAYYYPNGWWDSTPVAIRYTPGRLWNWRDTQLRRTWRAGPGSPDLAFQWVSFLKSCEPAGKTEKAPRPGVK